MSKFEKLILKLLAANSDQNFEFTDLTKVNVEEIINLQPKGNKAKPYQVKQVGELLLKYKLIPDVGA